MKNTREPVVGTRYVTSHDRGFKTAVEYVGLNPAPEYEGMDRYLVRTVETFPGGPDIGMTWKVEAKWFETHRAVAS